jgi:cytochrome b subunit of formate dehydrogenase
MDRMRGTGCLEALLMYFRHCRQWSMVLTLTTLVLILPFFFSAGLLAQDSAGETITSEDCVMCHEESSHGTEYGADISHSIHQDLECLDCHADKDTAPHDETSTFLVGCEGCRNCHEDASQQYIAHGRAEIGTCGDMPQCTDCHGDHDILPSSVKLSKTHPVNLPATCGKCHENLDITKKYDILIDNPIAIYEASVHGMAAKGGVYLAATCNDCHSTGGTAHKILSPGHPDSAINHFNIPDTCGKCHKGVENDFMEGVHGKLVSRGETDAPVCTNCHGEHGIISPDDPRSPVSSARLAEETCSPCHESAVLNAKYGLQAGRLATFIDSYHGLKSKAGDTHVANCASCHGVHCILPSSDPLSTVNPKNLQHTCGDCHPGISEKMAAMPIHGVTGEGLRTPLADLVENIYIIAIVVIIGLMVLHWLIDLGRHIILMMRRRPQVRRMRYNEIWQHTFVMVSFIVLVISGFALTYDESFLAGVFFGWAGGFELRGTVHRIAAVFFILTVVWHLLYLCASRLGREFFTDMVPLLKDFTQFWQRILYCIGRRAESPRFHRFSYVEKAEYWALVWGTAVMVVTGLLLWFDNWFINFLPKGFLDVALVIHFWEAWLASLAILVWHLYSTVFNPAVYPMNPSWLTGLMPEEMYRHEHPDHADQARKVTEERLRKQLEDVAPSAEQDSKPGE